MGATGEDEGDKTMLHHWEVLFLDSVVELHILPLLLICSLTPRLALLLFLHQLQRLRERLCLSALPVIRLSASHNEAADPALCPRGRLALQPCSELLEP